MKTATLDASAPPAITSTITSTIGVLSDRELLRQTGALVRHERHLQGAVIDHLAEIEARRLYLQQGCSSLFDYAVRELRYSDAAAGRRIGAVRLCADQPDARERLRDGSLTLSAAAELQWAFDRQRRRGSIAGAASSALAGVVAPGAAAAGADLPGSAPSSPAEVASADDPAAESLRRRWCSMRQEDRSWSTRRPARAHGRCAACWPTLTRSWRRRPTACVRSAGAATS